MQILLPFQDPYNHALTHPVVSGGTEMFCKSIYDNFDTVVHQVPYESINYSMKDKKKISQGIINHAENIGADIIISNFAQAIYCGSEIIKSLLINEGMDKNDLIVISDDPYNTFENIVSINNFLIKEKISNIIFLGILFIDLYLFVIIKISISLLSLRPLT